jgi:N-acetylglucosamine-6-phosphate deacetylase
MSAAGAPPGRYKLSRLEVEVGPDRIVRQPGKTNFAGSAAQPIDAVFRAAEMLGCPWQDVWPRLSETPAKFMGLGHQLAVGQPATFCLLKVAAMNQLLDLRVYTDGIATASR